MILRALAVLLALAGPAAGQVPAGLLVDRYDAEIERAVKRWWPELPIPAWWKAQLYQESRLRPDAVSPVGARGLAQFMPGTWDDMLRELRWSPATSPHDPIAIQAGAYYMAKLRRTSWSGRGRPVIEAHRLAQASYNAGTGNVLRAQRACANARDWHEIAPCMHMATGERNAHETRTYVERIARWFRALVG